MQLRRSVLIALMIILIIYFEIHSCSEDSATAPEPVEEVPSILLNSNDCFFADEYYGWVVGQLGTMIMTCDGGESWIPVRVDDLDIRGVNFYDRQNGWIVGREGKLYSSSDGGVTWQRRLFEGYPLAEDFFMVEFVDEATGFILGYHGVFVTEDGGSGWENNWLPVVSSRGAWAMSIVDADTGFLLGSRWTEPDPEILYRSFDGGESWHSVVGTNASILRGIVTVEFVDGYTGWAGGASIMKTADGGSSWQVQKETATIREFCFLDGMNGYAVGKQSILKTEDGGGIWTEVAPEDESIVDLRSVHFIDADRGWVTGRGLEKTIGGRLYKHSVVLSTSDGGGSWRVKTFAYDITDLETSMGEEEPLLPDEE